jgi:murein DD-endopeptidase MepM/ murein hydrolase activator NlpD
VISLLFAALISAAPAPDLEGRWEGTLGGQLHMILTLARQGTLKGMLDVVEQGVSVAVESIAFDGDIVRLSVMGGAASFEGKLNREKGEIAGEWIQNGQRPPLVLAKVKTRAAKSAAKSTALDVPIDVTVPFAPIAFSGGGKLHAAYELHVASFGRTPVTLVRVEAFGDRGARLARTEGIDLALSLARPGASDSVGLDRLRIGPGLRAVVFMWIDLEDGAAAPDQITHRLTVTLGDDPEERSLTVGETRLGRGTLPTIGAPLEGDHWIAGNGPSNGSIHRRALIPVGGRARISQRYAIDWLRVGEDGKTYSGDPASNKSYRAYGVEAIAVADGVVTEVKDGVQENVPGQPVAVPITLETIAGNHVVLNIGQGYAFYAHFQPGSLRVKLGDRVKRGQVLGLVGNSGNSSEPHLHFHLSDKGSPLGAEGLPYILEGSTGMPLEKESVRFEKGRWVK